jgi:AraC-like DNA-binding protein
VEVVVTRDHLILEGTLFLAPMLALIGTGKRVERLVAARLGSSCPSAPRIAEGEPVRAPRHAVFELCEDLAREAGDPELGLKAARQRQLSTLAEFALVSAPNLGDLLALWPRIARLQNTNPFELTERMGRLVLRQHLGSNTARQFAESVIAFQVPAIRATVGEWAPVEVRFPHRPPDSTAGIEEVLGCPVRFDAPALEIEIARDDLGKPSLRGDPALHRVLSRLALEEQARLPPLGRSIEDQLRAFLLAELSRQRATLENAAAWLGMSARTLQRRLELEGTRYTVVVDDARMELATRLLREQASTVQDIAVKVGLGNSRSFHRAFQRWTRETPGQFRKRLKTRV